MCIKLSENYFFLDPHPRFLVVFLESWVNVVGAFSEKLNEFCELIYFLWVFLFSNFLWWWWGWNVHEWLSSVNIFRIFFVCIQIIKNENHFTTICTSISWWPSTFYVPTRTFHTRFKTTRLSFMVILQYRAVILLTSHSVDGWCDFTLSERRKIE